MPLSRSSRGATRVARIRTQSGRAIAHYTGLLVLVFLLNTGCRTPWGIEPLPIDQLEAGMDPDAVWRVLGPPEWTESIGETRPRSPVPGVDKLTEPQLVTAWGYSDERVDPVGLVFAGLLLPVYVPVYLVSLAFPVDEAERDCVWTDQRWIDLYFENDQLAEWNVILQPERGWCDNSYGYGSTWAGYWDPYPWTYARYYYHDGHHHRHHDHGDHHDDEDRTDPGDHHDDDDGNDPGDRGRRGRRNRAGNSGDSGHQEQPHDRDDSGDRNDTGKQRVTNEHRDSGSRDFSDRHRDSTSSRRSGDSRQTGHSGSRASSSRSSGNNSRASSSRSSGNNSRASSSRSSGSNRRSSSSRSSGSSRGSGKPSRPNR